MQHLIRLEKVSSKYKVDPSSLCKACIENDIKVLTNVDDRADFVHLGVDETLRKKIFNKRSGLKIDYELFNYLTGEKLFNKEEKNKALKRNMSDLYFSRSEIELVDKLALELKKNTTSITRDQKYKQVIIEISRLLIFEYKKDNQIYKPNGKLNASKLTELIFNEENPIHLNKLIPLNNGKGLTRDIVYRHLCKIIKDGQLT